WLRGEPSDAPLPPPAVSTTHGWTLGLDAPPRVEPSGAWDPQGARVEPLGPAGRGALFQGEVRELADGRLEVDYSARLAEALRLDSLDQLQLPAYTTPSLSRLPGGRVSLSSPNNLDNTVWTVGRARWSAPEADLRFARATHVDLDTLGLVLEGASANLLGRRKTLQADGLQPGSFLPDDAPHRLRYAPFGPVPRGSYDGADLAAASGLTRSMPERGVALLVGEAHYRIEELIVRGAPRATDLPAWATVAHPPSNRLRAELTFERAGPGQGGPLLGLRGPGGEVALLGAVEGAALELWLAGHLLASRELPRAYDRGTLILTRAPDLARLTLRAEGDEHSVELPLGLPLGAGLQLAYGSRGPALAFPALTLDWERSDPLRDAYDREPVAALAQRPAVELSGPDRARRAFLVALLTVRHDVARARELSRPPEANAPLVLREFADVEAALPEELRDHARVWQAWAALLAPSPTECLAATEELVARLGQGEARRRFADLRYTPEVALFPQILKGYCKQRSGPAGLDPYTRDLRKLAAELGLRLAEGAQRDALLVDRALSTALRAEAALRARGTLSAGERLEAEGALRDLSSLSPAPQAAQVQPYVDAFASLCLSLGRFAEGHRLVSRYHEHPESFGLPPDSVVAPTTYSVDGKLLASLGELRAALEVCLAGLAIDPGNTQVFSEAVQIAQAGAAGRAQRAEAQGLCAFVVLLAAELSARRRDPDAERWRELARACALAAGPDPDDLDLASYVRTRLGEPLPRDLLSGVTRPFAILTRARRGDPDARAQVSDAAAASRLARSVVLLDPELAPLVR
ncbi:MAG: hypothetical protein KDD82_25310, partial [Planctomycetes bacterium]|nr:hypothetical protein [Planctomycetota bacterium]